MASMLRRWGMIGTIAIVLVACSTAPRGSDAGRRDSGGAPRADAGPGDPEAAWIGTYRGTYEARAIDCTSGLPLMTDPPSSSEETITRDGSGRLVIDRPCPIPLIVDLDAPTHAVIPSFECDGRLSDGTPVHGQYVGGTADLLGGEELWYENEVEITYDGNCDRLAEHFTYGERVR